MIDFTSHIPVLLHGYAAFVTLDLVKENIKGDEYNEKAIEEGSKKPICANNQIILRY